MFEISFLIYTHHSLYRVFNHLWTEINSRSSGSESIGLTTLTRFEKINRFIYLFIFILLCLGRGGRGGGGSPSSLSRAWVFEALSVTAPSSYCQLMSPGGGLGLTRRIILSGPRRIRNRSIFEAMLSIMDPREDFEFFRLVSWFCGTASFMHQFPSNVGRMILLYGPCALSSCLECFILGLFALLGVSSWDDPLPLEFFIDVKNNFKIASPVQVISRVQ